MLKASYRDMIFRVQTISRTLQVLSVRKDIWSIWFSTPNREKLVLSVSKMKGRRYSP
jgi:hypothetical protein